jgi:hypothetical protein
MSIALRSTLGLSERFKAGWQEVTAGSWELRTYRVGIVLALWIGVVLRVSGHYFDQSALWQDEASWARRLVERSVLDMPIRPLAFMWLAQQLATLFGPSEFWLRFLPNTASIVALGFMPYIATQLLKSRLSRFLLVFVWAIQPALIDYAKEFKPYSFEVLVHLVPLLLYLKYRQTSRLGYLWVFLGCLPFLFPFAYNIAFAYPGLLSWGLYEAYRQRNLRGAAFAIGCGAACLALVGAIFSVMTLNRVASSKNEKYWGGKYDVYYTQDQADVGWTRSAWMSSKYSDMASLPGLRREVWDAPKIAGETLPKLVAQGDRLLWLGLHLAGLAYLLLRRRELFVLLFLPFLLLIAANVLGKWPIGAFRTNLFLCAYLLPIAALGFDWIATHSVRARIAGGAVIASLTIVPTLAFGFDFRETKSFWGARNHEATAIMRTLKEQRDQALRADPKLPKELLLLDCHTRSPIDYYLEVHPTYSKRYAEYFAKNFSFIKGCGTRTFTKELKSRLKNPRSKPFWVVASKVVLVESADQYVMEHAAVLYEKRFDDDHVMFRVEPRKRSKGS